MIPLFKPHMDQQEIDAVAEVIRSGWIGLGPKTREFEEQFARHIGVKHAIALNSCTAALHLAVALYDFPLGSEVITSPITFVSTAFAPLYSGLTPVFADVQEETLNIDPGDIRKKITSKTRAIIPVHYGGHPCDVKEIREIAAEHNLVIIEDAAHACGSAYWGKNIGAADNIACFSFAAIKNLSTGDGGMITTNDDAFNERLRRLRWTGISSSTFARASRDHYKWDYGVDELGYKFHMTDISAALGLVQLKKLERGNARRNEIFQQYNQGLAPISWLQTPIHKPGIRSSCHNYTMKVDADREALIQHLGRQGISAGVHYKPLYLHRVFQHIQASCPTADRLWPKLLTLPMYPAMSDADVQQVIDAVSQFSPARS